MKTRSRAVAEVDKEERRHTLLDAAERLFIEQPDRMANVSEVADAAGVAKGTVYLYFPSKEEMLLALHERQLAAFFDELTALLDRPGPHDFDRIFTVPRKHIVRSPIYLALSGRCLALMDREIPLERAIEFKIRVGRLLAAAGERLERHFPTLAAGDGIALLCSSYGLMTGLWQLLRPGRGLGPAPEKSALPILELDYEREVESALRALWNGTLARGRAAPRHRAR